VRTWAGLKPAEKHTEQRGRANTETLTVKVCWILLVLGHNVKYVRGLYRAEGGVSRTLWIRRGVCTQAGMLQGRGVLDQLVKSLIPGSQPIVRTISEERR